MPEMPDNFHNQVSFRAFSLISCVVQLVYRRCLCGHPRWFHDQASPLAPALLNPRHRPEPVWTIRRCYHLVKPPTPYPLPTKPMALLEEHSDASILPASRRIYFIDTMMSHFASADQKW